VIFLRKPDPVFYFYNQIPILKILNAITIVIENSIRINQDPIFILHQPLISWH